MKIENDKDFKFAENLVTSFKKASLTNFTGAEAFTLITSLDWLVKAMSDYKNPPPSVPVGSDPTQKITSITRPTKNTKK